MKPQAVRRTSSEHELSTIPTNPYRNFNARIRQRCAYHLISQRITRAIEPAELCALVGDPACRSIASEMRCFLVSLLSLSDMFTLGVERQSYAAVSSRK